MNKNLTEIVFILDRSGSMSGLESDTIGGFNAMIEKQKKAPGEALVSTILIKSILLLTKWKGSQRCVSVSIKSCCSNDMKRSLCTHIASCDMERSGS